MRLARLDLTRYGRFTDRSIHFPRPAPGAPDLHIVYGLNEAGKSTAFSAWLDLLYGIPMQSPYAFLHSYETMRIGAVLEDHDGRKVELGRIKRKAGALIDGTGAPLPQSFIDGLTGGVGLDAYKAMFSLNNRTLREGGEGILKSEGNLGEMLFSASAGLAGLAEALATLRKRADDFHSPGKRAHALADAKAEIADLARRHREIDVDAARFRTLREAVVAAEQSYSRIVGEHAQAVGALAAKQRALAALPHLARLAGAEAVLAGLPVLPPPPAGWAEELADLERSEAEVKALLGAAADQAITLARTRDGAQPDPLALQIAAAVERAGNLRSAHDEAVKDLPKRRDEADDLARQLADAARALGQPDRQAADLRLPADRLAALRDMVGMRLVAETEAANARREAEHAGRTQSDAEAALPEGTEDDSGTEALTLLLDRLRARDPGQALRAATEAARRTQDALSRRMAALRPFRGDPAVLDAQRPPTAGALAALSARIAAAQTDVQTAQAQARHTADAVAMQVAAHTAATVSSGDADAAASRARREALWSAHRRSLTADTADAFEVAMRRDDLAMADLAGRMADAALRRAKDAALVVARGEAAAAEQALHAALQHEAAALAERDAIRRALSPDLPAGMDVSALRDWLAQRAEALAAAAEHASAETALADATADHDAARAALAGLLPAASARDLPYGSLLALAEARSKGAVRNAAMRVAATQAARAYDQRRGALAQVEEQARTLAADWARLCADTWIAQDTPPGAANALLDRLAALDGLVAQQDNLSDRIAKMEANVTGFALAIAPLAARAGIDSADPSRACDGLRQRVDAATKAVEDRQRAETALADLADTVTTLTAKLQRITVRRTAMAGFFGSDDPTRLGPLMQDALDRADQQKDAATALRELSEALSLPPDQARATAAAQDRDALERDRAALDVSTGNLFTTVQESFATLTEARRALDAAGGDDAVARLDAERQAREDNLRDRVEAHLRLRFGLIALDRALLTYREEHRSTMLAHASAVFADITDGAYAGLSVQPGKSGDDLVALPRGGGSKEAQHLSEGTRIQLYLALRIAGYREFAASRPTVPFIADDIMETFDDPRSDRTFARLGEMAKAGQVIYLTHHQHLCDIARAACPDAQVHRLE